MVTGQEARCGHMQPQQVPRQPWPAALRRSNVGPTSTWARKHQSSAMAVLLMVTKHDGGHERNGRWDKVAGMWKEEMLIIWCRPSSLCWLCFKQLKWYFSLVILITRVSPEIYAAWFEGSSAYLYSIICSTLTATHATSLVSVTVFYHWKQHWTKYGHPGLCYHGYLGHSSVWWVTLRLLQRMDRNEVYLEKEKNVYRKVLCDKIK